MNIAKLLTQEDLLFYITKIVADEFGLDLIFERYAHHRELKEENPSHKWIRTGLRGKVQTEEAASFYFLKENKPRGKITSFDTQLIPSKYKEVARKYEQEINKHFPEIDSGLR